MERLVIGTWYDISPSMTMTISGTDITVSLSRARCAMKFPDKEGSFIMEGVPVQGGMVPSYVQKCSDDGDSTKPRLTLTPSTNQD